MLTPVSEASTAELVALSPPQISPSSQLSETGSDTSTAEVPEAAEDAGPTTESGSHADMSVTNGEPRTDEDKDPKKSKAHLHCPVCKVTVNSISQLEAHNSGTRRFFFLWLFFGWPNIWGIWDSNKSLSYCYNSLLSPPGTKHKLMLEGHSVMPRRRGKVVATRVGCKSKRLGSKGSIGVPSKSFQCEVCEIFVNSETQLSQVRVKRNMDI